MKRDTYDSAELISKTCQLCRSIIEAEVAQKIFDAVDGISYIELGDNYISIERNKMDELKSKYGVK